MTRRVSIKEVAIAAGVSRATAARALTGVRNVNPEIVSRVKRAADEMGYQRNALASGLRSQTTQMVGMVVPQIANPFFPILIQAIERRLQERGVVLLLCDSQDDPELEAQRVNALLERQVDGLVISPCHAELSRPTIERARTRLPVVQLDRFVDGDVTDWVGLDDNDGISQLISHLVDAGARSFAFISSVPSSSSARLRIDAYRAATAQISSRSSSRLLLGEFSSEWGRLSAKRLLAKGKLPDAIVCGNDIIAFGVLHELQASRISVPADVLVTGYDDIGEFFPTVPTLTTMRQPCDEVASRCIELLDKELHRTAERTEVEHLGIAPTLVPRESTRRGEVASIRA